jgi:hypothetical protein
MDCKENSQIDSATVTQRTSLREFAAVHIDQTFKTLAGTFENELFYNCTFHDVRNARFINCDLNKSRFVSDNPEDFMGLVVSLDCFTFSDIELSETAIMCLLAMILKTNGNTALRKKILTNTDHEKMFALLKRFTTLER